MEQAAESAVSHRRLEAWPGIRLDYWSVDYAAGSKENRNPNSSRNILSAEPNRLFRALRLVWDSLGTARSYVVVAFGIILVLAAIGFWHLIASANRSADSRDKAAARVSPAVQPAPRASIAPSSTPAAPQLERAIVVTDLTEAEERGPRGETFIVAKIGMAPRTTAEKDSVEIRVLFFDLDANNQMRPTDAQVTYQWITQVRDWTEPSPKYLAATYLKPRPSRHAPEQRRYGGFVVRLYSDGKLQDERSKPESLIASLRTNAPASLRPSPKESGSLTPTIQAAASPSPPPSFSPPPSEAPVPIGIPIPNKPGFVQSPYDPKFLIDVRGFPPGTLVNDPNTNKPFRIP
jgi:hypothetical protein